MAKKSPPLPRHRPSHSNRQLIVASLGLIIGTQTLGFGVIGLLRQPVEFRDLLKPRKSAPWQARFGASLKASPSEPLTTSIALFAGPCYR